MRFRLRLVGMLAVAVVLPGITLAEAVGPEFYPEYWSHDFGNHPITGGPAVHRNRIYNFGSEPLELRSFDFLGDHAQYFRLNQEVPSQVAPGEFWEFEVIFTVPYPKWAGVTIKIDTNQLDFEGNPITYTLLVTGNATNEQPVAVADLYILDEDTSLTSPFLGVMANDIDPDGTKYGLRAYLVTEPAHATHFEFNHDGTFTYTPLPDFNGADSFTYMVGDGFAKSAPETVFLSINSVVDAPELTDVLAGVEGPTNSRLLTLGVVPAAMPDAPDFIDLSEDPAFGTYASVPFTGQTSVEHLLAPGDGERVVFVRYRNAGGVSEAMSAAFLIDETPPATHAAFPLVLDVPVSTDLDSVDLRFTVGFSEEVVTGTTSGLSNRAVVIGGNINTSGLTASVTPSAMKSGVLVWTIQITGAVSEPGEVTVSLNSAMVRDMAGNALDTSGASASASLATSIRDWGSFE